MSTPDGALLDRVFGAESRGSTPEARARTSKVRFVRSQSQLALLNERAKGLPISAAVALELVGFSGLLRVIDDGAVVVNVSLDEPSRTIRAQRSDLGVTHADVAKASGLSIAEVAKSEERGSILPIRTLLRLSQSLGLDDDMLSAVHYAGADRELAYRLRTMHNGPTVRLSASLVLKLSEAAWVISKQRKIANLLGGVDKLVDARLGG